MSETDNGPQAAAAVPAGKIIEPRIGARRGEESGLITLTTSGSRPKAPTVMHPSLAEEGDAAFEQGRLYGSVEFAVPAADGSFAYPVTLRFETAEAAELIARAGSEAAQLLRLRDPEWS